MEQNNNPKKDEKQTDVLRDVTVEDYDYLAKSASTGDCTGLLYRPADNENEMESYQQVYQFLPPNVKVDGSKDEKEKHRG